MTVNSASPLPLICFGVGSIAATSVLNRTFMQLLTILLLCAITLGSALAQRAPDIAQGTSAESVIAKYGWPKGKSVTTDRESWIYDGFQVVFQQGRVVAVTYASPSGTDFAGPSGLRPTRPASSNPEPAKRNSPAPAGVSVSPPYTVQPRVERVASPQPPSRPPPVAESFSLIAIFLRAIWLALAFVVTGAAVIVTLRFLRSRQQRPAPESKSDSNPTTHLRPPRNLEESIARRLDAWREAESQRSRVVPNAPAPVAPQAPETPPPVPPPVVVYAPPPPLAVVVSAPPPPPAVVDLTPELLRQLEWKRFELIVARILGSTDVRAECTRTGADGGIDVMLYRPGEDRPYCCVQCKAWDTKPVGVELVRALLGSMTAEKIGAGIFVTTSGFTDAALSFARANQIETLSTVDLTGRFARLPVELREVIIREVTTGDYTTPTCPSCDVKLVWREKGEFWGCRNFPRCRTHINRRAA